MALVCDIKSNTPNEEMPPQNEDDLEDGEIEDDDEDETPMQAEPPINIENISSVPPPQVTTPSKVPADVKPIIPAEIRPDRDRVIRERPDRAAERRNRHEEKGNRKHMTEAEKSILHLRKREKMQREKWEKYRKDQGPTDPLDDDFAKNIEKTLATILSKKEKLAASGEEDKEEEKRGKKRKKHEKDRQKNKQRRQESPKSDELLDENEMLNIRGGSPEKHDDKRDATPSAHSDDSYDSEYSSDRSKGEERIRKRENKRANRRNREHRDRNKNRDRDRRGDLPLKDSQGVCVFYLQGKCQKNDCPYSHEAVPPMKLELCKFYLMDCCAKGEKCSYMHSEFPCKFYHTGLQCSQGENCKFAHGKPLSEGLKQILFKHIETAPRDILGGFPRMSREEALNMINVSQKNLQEQYGGVAEKDDSSKGNIPSLFDINVPVPPELLQGSDEIKTQEKADKPRNRRSRWQDPEPEPPKDIALNFPLKPFNYGQDQDMRVNSNGDVDMRTLPPPIANITALKPPEAASVTSEIDVEQYKREAGLLNSQSKQDVDARNTNLLQLNTKDVDIRSQTIDPRILATRDMDIRQLPDMRQLSNIYDDTNLNSKNDNDLEDEPMLQIDTGEEPAAMETVKIPSDLPKTQRDLFLRIQAQQKDNVPENERSGYEIDENINWYSDDDDDDENRLTIKVDNEDIKEKDEPEQIEPESIMSPSQIKPLEVVEKLGDLSKIDISAEVTKLLTSMSQSKNQFTTLKETTKPATEAAAVAATSVVASRDPRTASSDPRTSDPRLAADPRISSDPRRSRHGSTEIQSKSDKISIYEQGSIDDSRNADNDLDMRAGNDGEFRGASRSDVDLRNLHLSFKGMQNYTPATEIDATINSHTPIIWKVYIVEIPRPDYTGLKLSVSDAEKTGDPRLRKIFRLSVDEKDSPASPKASPKAGGARVDPRLRKIEEAKAETSIMNYNQQLNMLQSSAFYQSLTSNQKVLLNQELASRSDQTGSNDPVLNSLLSNLNLIPGANLQGNPSLGAALSILANVTKLNPMLAQTAPANILNSPVNPAILGQNPNLMNQMAQSIVQPGLLGAAPGIPNLPPDFSINFDPRNGGLLGNAPPPPFVNFPPDGPGNFANYNDDFYPPDNGNNFGHNSGGGGSGNNRDNRGFNRDRRRGRNNFNRNNGNRNFRNRNNRSNRSHTPP